MRTVCALQTALVKSTMMQQHDTAGFGIDHFGNDRRYMVVGFNQETGQWEFVAQRKHKTFGIPLPALGQLSISEPEPGTIMVDGSEQKVFPVTAAPADAVPFPAQLWGDTVHVTEVSRPLSEWLSKRYCGGLTVDTLRVVKFAGVQIRHEQFTSSCADKYPIHLITMSSVRALATACGIAPHAVVARFRANIVIDNRRDWPFIEDCATHVMIGDYYLETVGNTSRCAMVNLADGVRDDNREPLRTLTKLRRDRGELAGSPTFGIHLIARSSGTITLGDEVRFIL